MTTQKTTKGALIAAISLLSASLGITAPEAKSNGGGSGSISNHGAQAGSQSKITAAAKKGPKGAKSSNSGPNTYGPVKQIGKRGGTVR